MQSKKYKLVKLYPNSPKLDTIHSHPGGGDWLGTYIYDFNNNEFWQEIKEVKLEVSIGTKFQHHSTKDFVYTIHSVENETVKVVWDRDTTRYPVNQVNTFFEDGTWIIYKEKEFEILELTSCFNEGDILTNKGKDSWYGNHTENCTLNWLLGEGCKISKVKRLSDGVIFTIKDKVYNPCLHSNGSFTITGFCMDCNDIHILALGGNGGINITKIEHYKEPLFKDFLGNEVFEGDLYFFIIKSVFAYDPSPSRIQTYIAKKGETGGWSDHIYFKYSKDALEYIDQNKPIYSKKQIRDAVDYSSAISTTNGVFFDEFKFMQKLGL